MHPGSMLDREYIQLLQDRNMFLFSIVIIQSNLDKNECFAYGSNSYGQLSSEGSFISRPSQITSFKDMKIVGIYCGAYHSFVQNSKG